MLYKLTKEALLNIIFEHLPKLEKYEIAEIGSLILNEIHDEKYITIPVEMNEPRVIFIDDIRFLFQPKKGFAKLQLLSGEEVDCNNAAEAIRNYLESKFSKEFKMLDSELLVNLKTIRWYCSDMNRIYFSENKFMLVNGTAIKKIVKNELGKEKDIYLNKSKFSATEYYPLGNN